MSAWAKVKAAIGLIDKPSPIDAGAMGVIKRSVHGAPHTSCETLVQVIAIQRSWAYREDRREPGVALEYMGYISAALAAHPGQAAKEKSGAHRKTQS